MTKPTQLGAAVCAASGAFLIIDVAVIGVTDGPFGVVDNLLFLVGFFGTFVGAALAAWSIAEGRTHPVRTGVAAFAGLVVAIFMASQLVKTAVDALYGGHNKGMGESDIFTVGVLVLLLGGWLATRRPHPGSWVSVRSMEAPGTHDRAGGR